MSTSRHVFRKTFGRVVLFWSIVLVCIVFFSYETSLYAQAPKSITYTPISPIPGIIFSGESPEKYLSYIFQFGIGIAAVLAVIMITICGLKYVTTETFSGKSDAKECLWYAIGGLMLIFGAWLMLNTINPALVNFDFSSVLKAGQQIKTPGGGGLKIEEILKTGGSGSGYSQYQWTQIPSAVGIGESLYCKDALGSGWINVDQRFCGGNSPGRTFDCCASGDTGSDRGGRAGSPPETQEFSPRDQASIENYQSQCAQSRGRYSQTCVRYEFDPETDTETCQQVSINCMR